MLSYYVNKVYCVLLSENRKKQFERIIFLIAIITFIIHFTLIVLAEMNIFPGSHQNNSSALNPISAIYTPFSIILLYEIYLLIYYLPKSITIYLGKQYEIIALILIRKIFNDLSNLSIAMDSLNYDTIDNLLLTFAGLIILFLLIFSFYKLSGNKPLRVDESDCKDAQSKKFFLVKKILAIGLMIFFVVLFVRSFFELNHVKSIDIHNIVYLIKKMNATFFDSFFTALILTEVLLLLFTFDLSDKFSKVIRNSGFIVSTILLKLSFKTEGIMNVGIILVAVAFGVSILGIYRLFEKKL